MPARRLQPGCGQGGTRTLTKGKRFCVVTSRGHVALLTLTKVTAKSDHPERRALTFAVQRWLKT